MVKDGEHGDKAGRERFIYDRDASGKLTLEAKYELERLDKEVVRREYKESKADRDAFEETYVNLDPEYVFKRKPPQRLKWLEKAFKALLDNSIKANAIYDMVSHAKFLDGVNDGVGQAIFQVLEKNLGFFTPRQQKYFQSPRFLLYKKHAVMTVMESDEDAEEFKPAPRPLKDEQKSVWALRQEREQQRKREMDEETRAERKRQRDREARGGVSRSRSRSRASSASSSSAPPPPPDDSSSAPVPPPPRVRPNDAPKYGPGGRPKIERRIDAADGNMYTLADFILEYGGTEEEPPHQWVKSKNTAFMYNE